MSKKMWGGRFADAADDLTEKFGASIDFDQKLYAEDIAGSIAHAKGLAKQNIIDAGEAKKIIDGLNEILADIRAGKIEFSRTDEDIHMNIERILTERIGDVGKKLHTGRSRNDQVATDMRLYVKNAVADTTNNLKKLVGVLVALAEENLDTPMPAYTHLRKAQAVTLAHYLMAYVEMFMRDIARFRGCAARADISPLGAGALAGTTYPLDREFVANELGFSGVTMNSLDAVSDRDFALEYLSAAAISMMHLSRFSEAIIIYSTDEFGFFTLSDAYSTGSSMMPQKKNADFAELIRAKTGRVYGDLVGLLTVMKALPLAYNKDMQEDKEGLFDAVETLNTSLQVFTGMMANMQFNTDAMRTAAEQGFMNATDAADYLVGKGLSFRDAHAVIGKLVLYAEKEGLSLDKVKLAKLQEFSPLFTDDIYDAISLQTTIAKRSLPGGPAHDSVIEHIKQIKARLSSW